MGEAGGVTNALGHLVGLSMPPRAQTGLLSPAAACLGSLPGVWALHHTPTGACPHPAWANIKANIGGVLSWVLSSPTWPLPSSSHLPCLLPSPALQSCPAWAGPMAVPTAWCCRALGINPPAPAPLKGTAAAGGQGGVSGSPSAPGMEVHHGMRKWRSVKLEDSWSRVREMPTTH